MSEKTEMKSLSAIDGSILAVIAQTPEISNEQLDSLLNRATPEAKEIALKMVELRQNESNGAVELSLFSGDDFRIGPALARAGRFFKRKTLGARATDATTRTAQSILNWANMNTKFSR